jgi:3',5'-cyclic AMP phosphodiesterase CpdA
MAREKQSNQFIILHLSDIHFGDGHVFLPDKTTSGEHANERVPDLLQSISTDLASMNQRYDNVLLAITGDLTLAGADGEFTAARTLVEGLAKQAVLGAQITVDKIFIVPGNHDVRYKETGHEAFWKGYYNFYRDLYGSTPGRELQKPDAERFCKVHDFAEKLGLIVLELATCHHNHKETIDLQRGFIDQQDLMHLETQLKMIDATAAKNAVKVALLHHHPVLIPAFAEPGRNYDAVVNSGLLLNLLNDFGFHLVLHGHKHNPHSFVYDATCGWYKNNDAPMLIVAGGSAGSEELPEATGNSYNLINIRHNFEANETRVQVTTRGLFKRDESTNKPLLRPKWYWNTIKIIDRVLSPESGWQYGKVNRRSLDKNDKEREKLRGDEYKRLRQNMPIVEVVPSLKPDQEFEARMKIVGHRYRKELPKQVTWSAGDKFPVSTCLREQNEDFRNTLSFYGPMLIQVSMLFDDGKEEYSYIYADERRQ